MRYQILIFAMNLSRSFLRNQWNCNCEGCLLCNLAPLFFSTEEVEPGEEEKLRGIWYQYPIQSEIMQIYVCQCHVYRLPPKNKPGLIKLLLIASSTLWGLIFPKSGWVAWSPDRLVTPAKRSGVVVFLWNDCLQGDICIPILDPKMPEIECLCIVCEILLMEEILHHQTCMKPVNKWIFTISTGAGFLPPTVCLKVDVSGVFKNPT